ncbi:uncharacterized protein UV8b_03976 [Ustilaginoidea virens]|uniref:Sodium/calcium exchanger membrane region domain-containing protein n=1 Tax=Ustilaginoidea virens TaxID=1159556 RepID=A0A1B5KSD2_USTVR|nr:uncharacterized protein UV8b_03976 [Ustilaginoidea virens]QUC19735.1 hypothetical protein UV8b_03976 [Ustilaginoidea virens]GAO13792.1 hypothetical protein UVI_02004850 [Ustilaginoidea virens]
MPADNVRGSRPLRSHPFVATFCLVGLMSAYSFFRLPSQLWIGDLRHPVGDGQGPSLFARAEQLECSKVHSALDKCAFVRRYCQGDDAGLLPYLEWYYCSSDQARPVAFVLLAGWLGLLFTTIGIAASDFFSVNLSTIAAILGLSESLAGVTFLAFGNGSPDVFSTLAAMSSNSPSMAVGELIGAACFITGVVAGSMALVREFRVDKKTYARDIIFFIVAVAFSMSFLADGQLRFWECWAMVGYYILYVVTVVGCHWYSTRRRRLLRREGEARSHYYGMAGPADDELAGEPYRDEPEAAQDGSLHDSRRSPIPIHDTLTPERGPGTGSATQDGDIENARSTADGSDDEHDRLVAAEVSRSMRVLRPARRKSYALPPIRPSLVGAVEFRSALSQLQRESTLQLSRIPGRSYSDHQISGRPRRGTTSEVSEGERWETLSIPGGAAARDRAYSCAGMPPTAPAPLPDLMDEDGLADSNSLFSNTSLAVPGPTPSTRSTIPSPPFTVGGNLAPPPLGPPGTSGGGKTSHAEQRRGDTAGPIKLLIPSRRSSQSDASSTNSPFPHCAESPNVAMTPNVTLERAADLLFPPAGVCRRDNSFPDVQAPGTAARRPVRWWPYAVLPPPHVVWATLFPTLQGWRDKSIWDKFLSAISVPSIFLLVATLPVVESDTSEDSDDGFSTLHAGGGCGDSRHVAPAISVGAHEAEAEGEWERYRRHSRRASVVSAQPCSSQPIVCLETEDTAVEPQGAGAGAGADEPSLAKALSVMASTSHEDEERPSWNRWLACLQLFTGPLFAMMILWANMREELSSPGRTLLKMTLYTLVLSLVLLAFLFVFTSEHKRPRYHFLLCFLGFVISIAWISTIAGEVVGVLKTFGVILNISEALLGLTIFAAGNSVGDLVADITVARLGYPVMALSACFGGPMLNILLGIGIGGVLMMVQKANKKHAKHPTRPIEYGPYSVEVGPTLMISAVTLLIMLTMLLVAVPLNKWILSRKIGWGLIALWTASTVANVVVEVTGVWKES